MELAQRAGAAQVGAEHLLAGPLTDGVVLVHLVSPTGGDDRAGVHRHVRRHRPASVPGYLATQLVGLAVELGGCWWRCTPRAGTAPRR
jgi:hypothetical protein